MKEKLVLVTGGSAGVGRAAALGLARLGARIVLLSRDQGRAEQTRQELVEATGNEGIDLLPADLAEWSSVRAAVRTFEQRYDRLDVLMNCAGVLYPRRTVSVEGVEMTLAVEFLGHFLLTTLLLGLLKRSVPARVLTVTGNAGPLRFARIHFDDLQLEHNYGPARAKLQAELAKALFSMELARRLEGTGITSNAFHPGLIRSRIIRHLPWYLRVPGSLGVALLGRETDTGVYLATAPEVDSLSGRFFEGVGKERKAPLDPEEASRLWGIAETLTGVAPSRS
ncbi:MAG: SDR family NAD(P)-dependent oxidoreductase [Spirochaetaceae bacterium]|nr:MAG: SDR family NAD(P)-dependent oxidoreductase [Spirochaetaceae bacterium]